MLRAPALFLGAAAIGAVGGFLLGTRRTSVTYWLFPYPNGLYATTTDTTKVFVWAMLGAVVAGGATWLLLRKFGKTGTT